ncbi:MAG: ribonuclease HII [Saprospiraceae bacterium]|nr:ribonuclease HII [Saprospiraceae bacterium]
MALRGGYQKGILEAGCDEAGRGCLAGPVFAAAVILPAGWNHPLLHDSKQLTEKQRELLRPIIEKEALSWAVTSCTEEEIDQINILQASILAMHRAIGQLTPVPQHLIIDGNRFNAYLGVPHTCIVGGDGKFRSIAAASILAKTHRDEHMNLLHTADPRFGWLENKGYPTSFHRQALARYGPTIHHRKTFKLEGIRIAEQFGS